MEVRELTFIELNGGFSSRNPAMDGFSEMVATFWEAWVETAGQKEVATLFYTIGAEHTEHIGLKRVWL